MFLPEKVFHVCENVHHDSKSVYPRTQGTDAKAEKMANLGAFRLNITREQI